MAVGKGSCTLIRIFIALGLMALVPVAWAQQPIHIDIATPMYSLAFWGGELSPGQTIEIELEPGNEPYGAAFAISNGGGNEYRVSVQFETSLAVGAEGPHIDLLDFKHCLSEWVPARTRNGRSFGLPIPTDAQRDCVPQATMPEVRKALRAQMIKMGMQDSVDEWLGFIRDVKRAGDEPMYAGISRVFVRVEAKRNGEWKAQGTVVFLVPMGC